MEKYKIIWIVILAVLLFQIRGSQSRSLNDDESEHTSDKIGNIEDWTTECVCFPKTDKGTPVSKFLPSYEQMDRLVVYFYKNKISGELTYYIPSWKKQIDFPDLTFDIDDKLETGTIDGIIDLFDTAKDPERLQVTTVTKGIPFKNVTVKPGVHLEIINISSTDNQHKNNSGTSQSGLKPITVVEIPSKKSIVSVVSPGYDKKITTGVTIDQDLNLSLGTNQQPLKGNIINVPNQNLKPVANHQNPQAPVISGGSLSNLLPGKPGTEGETIIINPPENQIEISNKPQNQNLVSPIGQQNQLIKGVPHVSSNNLNLAINRPTGLGELMKYVLPGHGVLVSPSKSNNGISSTSWIDTTNQNKQTNLVNIGLLPSKYNNPTFNNWFNEQILTIRSQRPSMSHTINFHVLKLLLIKALHENGISVSENGDLRDSNGNILKMTNLKIRPILLGDPKDYQKLIDTKTCVIPYDLPYLEAVLVTLIYPPRILAIIPLGVENVFISTLPGKTAPNLCGQSKCHTSESSRSGLSEKEEDISDINDSKHLEDTNDDLYNTEQKSEEPIEEEVPTYSDNIESKNAYTYMSTNPPEDFSLEQKYEDHNLPWDIKDSNSQNTLLRGLTPSESDLIIWSQLLPLVQSGSGISGRESMYINDIIPIGFKKNCGHKYCQINESFRSGLPENEEQTSFKEPLNLNKANEENDDNALISGESDGTIEDNMDYMAANEDLPGEANSDSQTQSNSEICGRILFPKGSHFRSSISEVDKPRNGLNTIIDNEDNDENLQFEEEFGKTLENNEPIYYSNDVTPLNDHSYAARRNNLPLPIIDNSQNSLFQPSQIIYTQPQFGREVFYLDENGNVEGRKSLDDFDDSLPEIPQTPDKDDYDMLHIRIVGGNPATSSGTPVSSRGRSGLNS